MAVEARAGDRVDELEDMVVRRNDFSLNDEQESLVRMYRDLLDRYCPPAVVRASEPLGYDESLWKELCRAGTVAMGLPEELGGDGGGLVELVLVAEQHGAHLTPAPFVETLVASRLLGTFTTKDLLPWLSGAIDGSRILSFDPVCRSSGGWGLVPGGAVAAGVVGLDGEELVLASSPTPPPLVPNHGSMPLARWSLSDGQADRIALATGPEATSRFKAARREWRLLTASALVGIAVKSLDIAAKYAKSRIAFGAPIGYFQAISHPLVDIHIGVDCARRLIWKAAWFADNEPEARHELSPMAFAHASTLAMQAGHAVVHVLGGVGYTRECDAQLYFRRAKAWALVGGSPESALEEAAESAFGLACLAH
jgi:alkylation response protein AidB-like acyl-CoA dehydrogenase